MTAVNRDAIEAELLEIEAILAETDLKDEDHGAQQALCHALDPDTWHPARQTFYRLGARPIEAASKSLN
ncbi:hypothetical protein [Bradyrhizobium sp. Leo121]|uniref:hypothetical protein n=1 Tax=Bradyrhizobium sp. Leo121 TaxID=1571195 RepID=UPI00102A2FF3|nr:hypothetical protein [Bradyrhizobium sp. Leo121]RZN26971.1 hypothetical protein CWO90_25325 [Bradyrhizobium sp. Leo121]